MGGACHQPITVISLEPLSALSSTNRDGKLKPACTRTGDQLFTCQSWAKANIIVRDCLNQVSLCLVLEV